VFVSLVVVLIFLAILMALTRYRFKL